jgi:hypothetical protein
VKSLLPNYLLARQTPLARVCESPRPPRVTTGELELQAAFYAGDFGLNWLGVDGENIEAIHLGEWNREPGPDFVGARLRMDGREFLGDIEIDREDVDWERHGHATNPAFDHVILHVMFHRSQKRLFTRTSKNAHVPQVVLSMGSRSTARPPLRRTPQDPGDLQEVLEAAARFRLSKKRERWLRAEALHGTENAFFQAAATSLGYKNNKVPFLLTAQRVGLQRASNPEGEALLFGIAGFLGAEKFDVAGADARSYARSLWDIWWTCRDRDSRLMLAPEAWNFSATRPANHPHRRMGALAAIATNIQGFSACLGKADPAKFLNLCANLHHPFWESQASLSGVKLKTPCALLGVDRATEMAANLLAPAADMDHGMKMLASLRCLNCSSKVKRALTWLGVPAAHSPSLITHALGQQALLQIYEDFFPADPEDVLRTIREGVRN